MRGELHLSVHDGPLTFLLEKESAIGDVPELIEIELGELLLVFLSFLMAVSGYMDGFPHRTQYHPNTGTMLS